MSQPFDAVLLVAFGGPQGPPDVRPFLANVLRGRRVAPGASRKSRITTSSFGGVSPLTELTLRRPRACAAACAAAACRCRSTSACATGIRSSPTRSRRCRAPASAARSGFIAAAQRSYSSCTQYRENVARRARRAARARAADVEVIYVGDWHDHPRLHRGQRRSRRDGARDACRRRCATARELVFTAHSIPVSMAAALSLSSSSSRKPRGCVRRTRRRARSTTGRSSIRAAAAGRRIRGSGPTSATTCARAQARGLDAVVLCPIGFLCDHVEVLYDLDVEAAASAARSGCRWRAPQRSTIIRVSRHDGGRRARACATATQARPLELVPVP